MNEIREVLRLWLGTAGLPAPGLRTIAEHAGVDRKTVRRYVEAAQAAGLSRIDDAGAVSDEVIAAVVATVRPDRPHGHGAAWEQLVPHQQQITKWVAGDGERKPLTIAKIEVLLARQGCVVPYRTLHRFATEMCGFGRKDLTVRVVDGEPGIECQIDFGYLGMLTDPDDGRARKVHALIFTAVYSRHMFVWLSYSQTLVAVIAGCEAAWKFFGGVYADLSQANITPVVTAADPITPRLSDGWLDYSAHVGFITDPARVRSPKDKPRVERTVQYVRGNFWAGERFNSLEQAQEAAVRWCSSTAGMRIHGTTCARPLEVFDESELPKLLPVPAEYDVPIFKEVKVHRDFHAEIGRALYSLPQQWIGSTLSVRADTELVKFYHRGTLVKIHPRQPAGGRSTDRADLPEHKTDYALRDVTSLIRTCNGHGRNIGIYAERILDDPLPWTRIRSVYRLQGLVRRYGAERVEQACSLSLDLDVVSVTKIASMLERATESSSPDLPKAVGQASTRFSRDPSEFRSTTTPSLTVVDTGPASVEGHS